MAGSSIAERLRALRDRIARACAAGARDPNDVRTVAVSKLHDAGKILEARVAGQIDFGENYVQESVAKIEAWRGPAVDWHFVGRIQGNKVRAIANRFAWIHSIDRFEIAERLDRATESRQNVLLQMNVANEATKGGASAAEILELARRVMTECPRLAVRGLMVMPPASEAPGAARPHFRRARETLDDLRALGLGHPLDHLSMGTSGDFEDAIAEGATWIRIGTEIFGPRTRDA